MKWLMEFAEAAQRTDRLADRPNHVELLAAGLMGEAGSVLAELKKEHRERDAYPVYRHRMVEEVGDFLWYFVRLVSVVEPNLLSQLEIPSDASKGPSDHAVPLFLDFGGAVGAVLPLVSTKSADQLRNALKRVWKLLMDICAETQLDIRSVGENNIKKVKRRWPTERNYMPLFDVDFDEEEQLPRKLEIEFRERAQNIVVLRCNRINFGDRLTDNIQDPDGYRCHDIFHFAYAVHLGWSPVTRALLRAKRKSNKKIDEAEDGARAAILEEAVSAIVFSRAKRLNFFDGIDHVDYDLLKTIQEFIEGYEVERIPLWQWELAILDGYRVFRQLRNNRGGRVILDLPNHQLKYLAPGPH